MWRRFFRGRERSLGLAEIAPTLGPDASNCRNTWLRRIVKRERTGW